jgi:hypothetical protein
MNYFTGFLSSDGEVKKIINRTRQVGRESFANLLDEEVEKHSECVNKC